MEKNENHFESTSTLDVVVGGILVFIATIMLLYTERVSISMKKEYASYMGTIVEKVDTTKIDPALDGKILYFGAWTKTNQTVTDPMYELGGKYLSITRDVMYYQWVETQTKEYDKTEKDYYTNTDYDLMWVSAPINSKEFDEEYGHENVAPLIISPMETYVTDLKIGPYWPDRHIERASCFATEQLEFEMELETAQRPMEKAGVDMLVHLLGKEIYYGKDPSNPHIGDVRVSFTVTHPVFVYVMAQADGDSLRPYRFKTLDKGDYKVNSEPFKPQDVINDESDGYDYLAIMCRIIAWLFIVWGVYWLRGLVVYPMRKIPGIQKIMPKADNKWTLWVAGTYLTIALIIVCNLFARLTT